MVTKVKHPGYCVAKVLLISVLYVLNISIVFVRSQKILQAFHSKVRLTEEEAKRTIYLQTFIVCTFLMFINGVLGISIFKEPMRVLEIRYSLTLTKQHFCNTYYHSHFIIGSTMIIQLLCSIQAFGERLRCKHIHHKFLAIWTESFSIL